MASANMVILLLGLHGVGKSTFARAATNREDIDLGYGVGPCTRKCSSYTFDHTMQSYSSNSARTTSFTIIDTPGLADTNTTEENLDVLRRIADYLRGLGQERVSGVIYFHSIEGVRLHGVDMQNLRILKGICGEPFFPRVAFVTTRWDRMGKKEYKTLLARNAELEVARQGLLPSGPKIFAFLNDGQSHKPVLDYFAHRGSVTKYPPLLFTQELEMYRQSKLRSAVKKTTAGKEILKKSKGTDNFFYGLQQFFRDLLEK